MTFLMHWSFKTGYHEIAAKKFLSTGAPFPACKSWKRFHGPGSVEGWILVEADSADACYEHAAEWAECLDWEVTPVLTDDQAGPLIAKAYSWISRHTECFIPSVWSILSWNWLITGLSHAWRSCIALIFLITIFVFRILFPSVDWGWCCCFWVVWKVSNRFSAWFFIVEHILIFLISFLFLLSLVACIGNLSLNFSSTIFPLTLSLTTRLVAFKL